MPPSVTVHITIVVGVSGGGECVLNENQNSEDQTVTSVVCFLICFGFFFFNLIFLECFYVDFSICGTEIQFGSRINKIEAVFLLKKNKIKICGHR